MSSVFISGPDARLRFMQCRCRGFRAELARETTCPSEHKTYEGYCSSIEAVHRRLSTSRRHFELTARSAMPSVLINIAMLDAHHRINMQELASSEITFCSTAPRRP